MDICRDCKSSNIDEATASEYFDFEDETINLEITAYKCKDCGYIWGYV